MSINIGPAPSDDLRPKIMVIGVGGAGGNAIANMMSAQIEGVEFIVANTDAQALSNSMAERRIQLGPDITGGLGAGARPEVGKAAAEETVEIIEEALDGVNMCFIAAGMGGGTGTGAAPVIAEAARRKGVLTVGVVTKPFQFEGQRRMRAAEAGIDELQKHVDTLIVIPNQNLFLVAKAETTFKEAFQLADEVLQQGVRSITDLMVMPGLINLDFADVRSVMQEMGKAMMGTGEGEGENRALEAAEKAIANPLLDGVSMAGAKGVIISIIGGEDMKLLEVDEAANHIRDLVDEDANIIWGSAFNPDLQGKIRVSVVATGIDSDAAAGTDRPLAPAMPASKPFSMSDAKPPKRPVLDLPDEDAVDDAMPLPQHDPAPPAYAATASAGTFGPDEGEDEDEYDDVDDIVDPLAGLRNDDDGFGADDDAARGRAGGGAASYADEPLDLADELDDGAGYRGSELGSVPGSPLQSKPLGRRRNLVSGAGEEEPAPRPAAATSRPVPAGSTLFERMANLSRGPVGDDDEDDADEGRSLNIPRFLGRQNNQ